MDETGSAKYDSVAELFEDTCSLEEKLDEEKKNSENKPSTSTSGQFGLSRTISLFKYICIHAKLGI